MKKLDEMTLYAITDSRWAEKEAFLMQIEQVLSAGVNVLQLREKELDDASFLERAKACKVLCDQYKVPLIINDRVEIAKTIGASGVHVGQSDLEAGEARTLLGEEAILGVSAHSVEEARLAEKNGADYIGVGAMFQTGTKKDATTLSFDTLREIVQSVTIPVVAIGGINEDNIDSLKGTGISGVAVVSCIFAKKDCHTAAKLMKEKAQKVIGG